MADDKIKYGRRQTIIWQTTKQNMADDKTKYRFNGRKIYTSHHHSLLDSITNNCFKISAKICQKTLTDF